MNSYRQDVDDDAETSPSCVRLLIAIQVN